MRIAVNTRLLLPEKLEGIGRFIKETTERLVQWHPEHEFHLLFDRQWHKSMVPEGAIPHIVPPPARHPLLFHLWFEYALPIAFQRIKPDLFISPDGYLSLRSAIPSVQVLHDLNFEHEDHGIPARYLRHYRKYFPRYARHAKRIATVSQYSKADICKTYEIDEDKIDVVFSGQNPGLRPAAAEEVQFARNRFAQGKPYFIYVGSLHERKNIGRTLQAFDMFAKTHEAEVHLVLAGKAMFGDPRIEPVLACMEFRKRVHLTGRLSDEELTLAIAGAMGMVFISLFEGFGLPIVEAFQCGIPLITSNMSSMPEIAGDAALLVDPLSIEASATAMSAIATDAALRSALIEKGHHRKELFTWDRTASLLWQCILKSGHQAL